MRPVKLAFFANHRHMRRRESDGRGTRQSGQILTEAATTNSLRVIRLLQPQLRKDKLMIGFDKRDRPVYHAA